MSDIHNNTVKVVIDDFDAQWERLTIRAGKYIADMDKPQHMWSTTLSGWVMYCPADANGELNMLLGEEISITTIGGHTLELRLPSGKLFAAYTTREDL